jgi:hypothetical protein
MQVTEKWPLLARLQFAPRCIFSKSPCIFAKSREIPPGDGFADDWLVSQGVRSPGYYFPMCRRVAAEGLLGHAQTKIAART